MCEGKRVKVVKGKEVEDFEVWIRNIESVLINTSN